MYSSVGDIQVMWMLFGNVFFTLATVMTFQNGLQQVKCNWSKCIVYALGIAKMMELNFELKIRKMNEIDENVV